MKIKYSSKFARSYKKLPSRLKDKAEKQEDIFRQDPFDSRLKTHRLTRRLKGFWSFSVDHQNRIIFEFVDNNIVWFLDVGNHDVYKR